MHSFHGFTSVQDEHKSFAVENKPAAAPLNDPATAPPMVSNVLQRPPSVSPVIVKPMSAIVSFRPE